MKKTGYPLFFLDQGEFLGGAERFLLDFLNTLKPSDLKSITPIVIGAQSDAYRDQIKKIKIINFSYPSVRGSLIKKCIALFRILLKASQLKTCFPKKGHFIIFSNSPRTHFVMYLARVIFRVPGKWICMFHDFTLPPFLLKQISSAADVLMANGEPMNAWLEAQLYAKDLKKIQHVSNGIDFKKIPPPRISLEIKKILILGRIDPRKGQMYALQAANIVQQKYPNVIFSFVGSPVPGDARTQSYDQKLHRYKREHKMKNVTFVSEVATPFQTLLAADLVLFLPTEPETFGRVVIEALALGKLVLAFDETGPREILHAFIASLKNTSHTLITPSKNVKALAAKILYFMEHAEEAQKIMKSAQAFVKKKYCLKTTKRRLLNIFETTP